MNTKRQHIAPGLVLNIRESIPGSLTLVIPAVTTYELDQRQVTLSPEEVDQLVLHALGMTKPEGLDPSAAEDYESAMEAVRVWQGTRAVRESVRPRDAERDEVMREVGHQFSFSGATVPTKKLVDMLIKARKEAQK